MARRFAFLCAVVLAGAVFHARAETPKHQVPPSKDGNLVVGLCDGETSVEVPGVKEGETLDRARAQEVADQLMAEWRSKNPDASWDEAVAEAAQQDRGAVGAQGAGGKAPAVTGGSSSPSATSPRSPPELPPASVPPPSLQQLLVEGETAESGAQGAEKRLGEDVQSGHTYGAFSKRDVEIWNASTVEFVARGNRIFHDAKELGGTVGVSCDMCHPNAANTHPETYPKYQVQLGRVALLRDMINWCIENPVRGKPLPDDDERLKALEAYILASRKGVELDYGKH